MLNGWLKRLKDGLKAKQVSDDNEDAPALPDEVIDWEVTDIRDDDEAVAALRAMQIGSYGFTYSDDGVYVPMFDGVDYFRIPIAAVLTGDNLCISGSRDFNDWELVRLVVKSLPSHVAVITGGARGVDREAYLAGQEFRLNQEVYPAEWGEYGKSAGVIRNTQMIDDCTDVIAFWDMKSPGTRHAIGYANTEGKLRFVFPPRERWKEYNEQKGRVKYIEESSKPLLMSVATDLEDA